MSASVSTHDPSMPLSQSSAGAAAICQSCSWRRFRVWDDKGEVRISRIQKKCQGQINKAMITCLLFLFFFLFRKATKKIKPQLVIWNQSLLVHIQASVCWGTNADNFISSNWKMKSFTAQRHAISTQTDGRTLDRYSSAVKYQTHWRDRSKGGGERGSKVKRLGVNPAPRLLLTR